MANKLILSLGCNLENAVSRIENIIDSLSQYITIERCSSIYRTAPYGGKQGRMYANAVVYGNIEADIESVQAICKDIEISFGRNNDNLGEVSADIDVIFWNNNNLRPHETGRDYFLIGYNEISGYVENNS